MNSFDQIKLKEGALKEYTYSVLSFAVTETLVNYRKENGVNQKELAKILGVSQARISKIEAGNNITLKMLCDINDKLETKDYSFILSVLDNMKKRAEVLYNKSYYIEITEEDNTKIEIADNNIEYHYINKIDNISYYNYFEREIVA